MTNSLLQREKLLGYEQLTWRDGTFTRKGRCAVRIRPGIVAVGIILFLLWIGFLLLISQAGVI